MAYETYNIDSMGKTTSLYGSDSGQTDPLYDASGNMKDLNHTVGDGLTEITRGPVIQAYMSAQATVTAAQIEAQATAYAAEVNAEAAVNAAYAQADATMYASDNDLKGIQAQVATDLEIAKLEQETEFAKLEVEKESVEVDKLNAQANQTTANASIISANAEQTEADAEMKEAEDESNSDSIF